MSEQTYDPDPSLRGLRAALPASGGRGTTQFDFRTLAARAALISCLLVAPNTAVAAGFYISDIGARGLGRGGAFVAAPDSLLAASYNPAALAQLKGLHVELSVAYVELNAQADRRCPCLDPATDAELERGFRSANTSTPLAIPFAAIGYGFEDLRTHIALAAWGPNSGRHDWSSIPNTRSPAFQAQSEALSQRYSAFDVDNFEANLALSVAMAPFEGFRMGFSWYAHWTGSVQSLSVWANSATFAREAEDTRFDVPIEVTLPPTFGWGWGLGVSWEIIDGLSIGSSFRGERKVVGKGELDAQLPVFFIENFEDSQIIGDEVEIELNIAPIWRAGIEYRWPKVLTVEFAVVWEGWSTHDRITVRPQGVEVIVPISDEPIVIPELVLERDWVDTWSFRIGGEIHPLQPYVDFRWGYFYETSAVPARTVAASRIDRPKHGVSLGAAVKWRGMTFELAASYIHLLPISIDDSDIRVTGVFPTEPLGEAVGSADNLSVVGNGDISAHYLIGAVSVSFAIDDFYDDSARW